MGRRRRKEKKDGRMKERQNNETYRDKIGTLPNKRSTSTTRNGLFSSRIHCPINKFFSEKPFLFDHKFCSSIPIKSNVVSGADVSSVVLKNSPFLFVT